MKNSFRSRRSPGDLSNNNSVMEEPYEEKREPGIYSRALARQKKLNSKGLANIIAPIEFL